MVRPLPITFSCGPSLEMKKEKVDIYVCVNKRKIAPIATYYCLQYKNT